MLIINKIRPIVKNVLKVNLLFGTRSANVKNDNFGNQNIETIFNKINYHSNQNRQCLHYAGIIILWWSYLST